MDGSRFAVRELRDSDLAAWAGSQTSAHPEEHRSVETMRVEDEILSRMDPELPRLAVDDLRRGEPVAFGRLYKRPFQAEPGWLWIYGEVRPDRRREGIGSHLYDTLLDAARTRGAQGVRCSLREEDRDAVSFLTHRGFEVRRRSWRSTVDPRTVDTSALAALQLPLERSGLVFTDLAREGANDVAVRERIHELSTETGLDVPAVGAHTAMSFEDYRRLFFEDRWFLPEAWCLVREGSRYVALSSANPTPDRPGVLLQMFTATRRGFRRQHLALILKLRLIEFAKQHGYERIETSNDSLNTAMWTLNQKLGFRKNRELLHVEKRLGPGR